jgi:hypothetical protein
MLTSSISDSSVPKQSGLPAFLLRIITMASQTKIDALKRHVEEQLRTSDINPQEHSEYKTQIKREQVANPSLWLADVPKSAMLEAERVLTSGTWGVIGGGNPRIFGRDSEFPLSAEVTTALNQIVGAELLARGLRNDFLNGGGAIISGHEGRLLITDSDVEVILPEIQQELLGRGRQTANS